MLNIRMIDAASDPDYVYVTSNNTTDGHGVRKVRKSDLTVVASLLATGAGDGQFKNPSGVKKYGDYVYICDFTNGRIVKLNASDLSFVANITLHDGTRTPYDLCTDGVNWFVVTNARIYKLGIDFSGSTYVSVSCYSCCIIPDQGDGNGQTLCIVDNINSHLARYKCSDLTQVGSDVGSSGDGSTSLFDPTFTTSVSTTLTFISDDGINYTTPAGTSHALSMNGFAAAFHRSAGPHRWTVRCAAGLDKITAIDANTDAIISIRNLSKLQNTTSTKLQTNTSLILDLGQIRSKHTTVWAYGCGAGISGSVRHLLAVTSLNLRENGASQAQVDAWIDDLYANKDVMSPVTANLNGSNSAPSAAGKAKADELINDYAWTIAYTA